MSYMYVYAYVYVYINICVCVYIYIYINTWKIQIKPRNNGDQDVIYDRSQG